MIIDLAYCIELKKTVDIYQACLEFSKQDKHEKFHFLCSDPECRASKKEGVRVSAINHQYLPEDDDISKSPHYRKWDEHIAACEWSILETILAEPISKEVEESTYYKLSKKGSRLISRFIIPENNAESDEQEERLKAIRKERNPEEKKKQLREYVRGAGSTATSMEALVSCYEELKSLHALDEPLTIVGYGATTFQAFFKQLKFAPENEMVILQGGAHLYKRYKAGFSLNFIDSYNRSPVSLYISDSEIRNSSSGPRLQRVIDELEAQKQRKPYVKVYWLGGLIEREIKRENDAGKTSDNDTEVKKKKVYSVNLKSLSHTVFRIAYPKNQQLQT